MEYLFCWGGVREINQGKGDFFTNFNPHLHPKHDCMINLFSPLRTVLIYGIFGIVWIFCTDSLLGWLSDRFPGIYLGGQHVKGIIFVVLSAGLLYWLLQKYLGSLRRSETAYLRIFKTSPNPMWIYSSEDFGFIDVNEAAVSTYGYSYEEFKRMTILDIRPAEDVEKVKRSPHNYTNGYSSAGVWRHLKKDGTLIYVEIQAYGTVHKGGNVVVVSGRDVTDTYLADQALSQQQQLLSTIINSTDDLIWAVDTNMHFVAFNDAFKNTIKYFTGVDLQVGHPLIEAEGETEHLKWQQYYQRSLQGQKQVIEEVREMNNGLAYAEITMDPIINEGRVLGVACFAHNITERKEQELQLKKMLERYDVVNLATNDVIWDWDLNTNTVVWNRNLELLFGHHDVHQRAGWWEQHVHPDDLHEILSSLNETVENKKQSWKVEYRLRRNDGVYRHVIDRGYVIYNEEGKAVRIIGAIQDVEEKKLYIEELKKVAHLSSHSLRRPVASMLGIVAQLNKENLAHPDNTPLLEHVEKVALEMDSILHVVAEKCNLIFQQTEKV